ncbi:MAG TPA: ABC transporter ATP-binding protein, partial [Anaerolineales bacterium]|nr:ABC transporter ATP-binding protein [Anaerolineales bacterium]
RAQISKLHQRLQTTFIYVTHDQMEAMTMATRIAVMRDGLLHQLDTPQALYDNPTNVFVAGFIGSPAMNFFDAKLQRSEGKLIIDCGAFHVQIPDGRASKYQSYAGREVVFGIRPENIHDPNFLPPGIVETRVESSVDVTELMGNEVFLHLLAGDRPFIARVDPRTKAHIGDRMPLSFDMNHIHVFDKESQLAIS